MADLQGDITAALQLLRGVAAAIEPNELIPEHAAVAAEQLARAVHTATNALAIVVERAGESSRWRATGSRSVTDWVAKHSGIGFGDATAIVDASRRLARSPGATLASLREGSVSALAAAATLAARDAAEARHRRDAERAADEDLTQRPRRRPAPPRPALHRRRS